MDKENQKQNIEELNRDTKNALNALGKIFDAQEVQERQEFFGLFSKTIFNAIGDLGLKEGSPEKIALDAAAGAFIAKLGGADAMSGLTGAAIAQLAETFLKDIKDPLVHQLMSYVISGTATKLISGSFQTGAAIGTNEAKYNYLTHKQYDDYQAELEACKGDAEKEKEVKQKYEVISALQDKEWLKTHPFEEYAETIQNADGSISYVTKEQVVGLNTDGSTAYLRPGEIIVIGDEDISKIVDKIKPGNIIQMPDGTRYYVQPNGELKENADIGAFMTYQKVSFDKGDVETYRDMYIFGADTKIADDFQDKDGEAIVNIAGLKGNYNFGLALIGAGAIMSDTSKMTGGTILIANTANDFIITTSSFAHNVINKDFEIKNPMKDIINNDKVYDSFDKTAKMASIVGDAVTITAAAKSGKFNNINWDKVPYDVEERNKAQNTLSLLGLTLDIKTVGDLIEK